LRGTRPVAMIGQSGTGSQPLTILKAIAARRAEVRKALRRGALLFATAMAAGLAAPPLSAQIGEPAEVTAQRARERTTFTDAEIMRGFFKVAFGAEFRVVGDSSRIRKYDVPVRVHIDGRSGPDRRDVIAAVVRDINSKIQHLDIAVADSAEDANVTVILVRDRDLRRTIRKLYGADRARQIQRALDPQCLSGFQKDDRFRIVRSDVILAADTDEFTFRDCVYEELLQSLGPINDTDVPWTMFNDDVQKGFFDVYDQYLLNILYHPRIKAGMTVEEVSALLPQVLPQVRAFVEGGQRMQ